jgi:hypothetical protein
MNVVTCKCPVSSNVIVIRFINDNAHIEDISFDDKNIKSFFSLIRNIVEMSIIREIKTFTQVVTDEDWDNVLCDINEWSVMSELKDMKLKVIKCDTEHILHCIGKSFGMDCCDMVE